MVNILKSFLSTKIRQTFNSIKLNSWAQAQTGTQD